MGGIYPPCQDGRDLVSMHLRNPVYDFLLARCCSFEDNRMFFRSLDLAFPAIMRDNGRQPVGAGDKILFQQRTAAVMRLTRSWKNGIDNRQIGHFYL